MKPLFALCGPIGSGKSSVSKLLAEQIGARWNSFGRTTREIAEERNVPSDRVELQKLGANLIENERQMFCRRVLAPVLVNAEDYGIIDGVRHADVLQEIRAFLSPRRVMCIYVDVEPEIRMERLGKRDGLVAHDIAKLDGHSTEVEVQTKLRNLADLVVHNNGTLEECVRHIVAWVRP